METTREERRFIAFPIPEEQYEAVLAAVLKALGEGGPPETPSQTAPVHAALGKGDPEWSRNEIGELKHNSELHKSARTLLELTAAKPGEKVTIPEIMEASGRTHGGVRGDLSGLTKLIKREFPSRTLGYWPVRITFDPSGKAEYVMRPEIAEWWNEA
jgi:hypothetical protein